MEAGERGVVGIREAVGVVVSATVCVTRDYCHVCRLTVSSQEEEVVKEEVGVMEWPNRVGRIKSLPVVWGNGHGC